MKQFIKIISLLVLTISTSRLNAQLQGQAKIDSLLKELPKQKEDTNKVNLLNGICLTYFNINLNEGIQFGHQALDLSEKLGWKMGMANAKNRLGICYQNKHDYNRAMLLYNDALIIFDELKAENSMVKVYNNLGSTYSIQNNYTKAIEYFLKSEKLNEKAGNKAGTASACYNIGFMYYHLSQLPDALKYYNIALKIYEEIGDKNGIGGINLSLGNVYEAQSDFPKALECYFKVIKTNETNSNKKTTASALGNIGSVYASKADYPKALEYHLKALKITEEMGDKIGIANANSNIGIIYSTQHDLANALEYFSKALKIDEAIGNKEGEAIANGNIGGIYSIQNNYSLALDYYLKQLKFYEETGNKNGVASATANTGTIYKNQKNYIGSIACYQKALKIYEETGNKQDVASICSSIGANLVSLVSDTLSKAKKEGQTKELREMPYLPDGYAIPKDKAGRLKEAIIYLNRGIKIANEIKTPIEMLECQKYLAEAYRLNGDYKKALELSNNWHTIMDSVFSKENEAKLVKMEMKNGFERQHFADSLKTDEKEKITKIQLKKQKTFTGLGIAGVFLLAVFSFFIFRERGKSEKERKKSDVLLLNILPEEVATELKINGVTKARHFDKVTVIFTDFVNFTEASQRMNPQALIDELHTCFKKFDEITEKYNIEKIKTIGDAYLAVCGLPHPDPKHAEKIVKAALEIVAFMQDREAKLGNSTFGIRIGIHTGSVVAGIVGVKKFAYDIWGDTVNTAARMEQNSSPGRINISQSTYELVKDQFNCEYRGEIDVKGKGVMKMYFINPPQSH